MKDKRLKKNPNKIHLRVWAKTMKTSLYNSASIKTVLYLK